MCATSSLRIRIELSLKSYSLCINMCFYIVRQIFPTAVIMFLNLYSIGIEWNFPQMWHWWHHQRPRNENFRKFQLLSGSGSTRLHLWADLIWKFENFKKTENKRKKGGSGKKAEAEAEWKRNWNRKSRQIGQSLKCKAKTNNMFLLDKKR